MSFCRCDTCGARLCCPITIMADFSRKSARAYVREQAAPECEDYVEQAWRGVGGVPVPNEVRAR